LTFSPRRNRRRVLFFVFDKQQTGFTLSQKNPQESLEYSRNNGSFFRTAFEAETMENHAEHDLSNYFSALGCALDQGRTAISMGGKTGNCEHNRNKLDLTVAHCRWGKIGIGGNCCAAPQMSRSATIHGTLGVIWRRGKSCFRFRRRRSIMVVMLMHGTITMVCRYCVTGNCLACSSACRRHNRREHG
jgi:hypothetical protein